MEIDRLRYFCTVAETGSLTRAAELIGITHSGLSKVISALESELGIKLFQPQGRGLEITAEGRATYSKALEVIRLANELKTPVLVHVEKPLRIGLSEVLAISCAGFLANEMKRKLTIAEIEAIDIEEQIVSGTVDFGIAFVPNPKPEIEYLRIGFVHFCAIARRDYDSKTPKFAAPVADLMVNPGNYKHRDGWPMNLARTTDFSVSSLSAALNLVKSGVAAVYAPKFIVETENRFLSPPLRLHALKDFEKADSRRPVYLIKQKGAVENTNMKRAAKVIRQNCCARA